VPNTTTTLAGVRWPGRGRRRGRDVFDVVLTADALVVERPGAATRRLPWEQVTEWELAPRRGSVLLTLRGGGAVTAFVVPRWRADDLNAALRAATAPPEDAALTGPAAPTGPAT
jgi:hypothetical protein